MCLVWLMGITGAFADDAGSYKQGKDLATTLAPQGVTLNGVNQLEGYASDNVSQKQFLDNPTSLTNQGQSSLQGETGKFLLEVQDKRPHFKDLDKDNYFSEADRVIADPLRWLKAQEEKIHPNVIVKRTLHKCIEGGEPSLHKCRKRRLIQIKEPKPKVFTICVNFYNHGQNNNLGVNFLTGGWLDGVRSHAGGGHSTGRHITTAMPSNLHNRILRHIPFVVRGNVSCSGDGLWSGGGIWGDNNAQVDVTYQPYLAESDLIEEEEDGCIALEDRAEQGKCTYEILDILDGEGSKTFGNEAMGTVTLHRAWWDKEYTYACRSSKKNQCQDLRAKGCEQVSSKCHKEQSGRCIQYQQTFACLTQTIGKNTVTLKGKVPYCLTGNCDQYQWAPNQDMAEAMSRLAVFKEMSKDMDPHSLSVFKGSDKRCRKDCLNFRDCCKEGKKWGETFGYKCSADEQALGLLRDQNKCVLVGTYCHEKILGQCITKKTSYCCFGTKLSKLIHEQGRGQLGLSWGSPKEPSCRGLSIEELSRIDFSKLDLSSLYTEIRANIKLPNIEKMSADIKENMRLKVPQIPTEKMTIKKENLSTHHSSHAVPLNSNIPQTTKQGAQYVF